MTREQLKKMLPAITAYAGGGEIQYRNSSGKWEDVQEPMFLPTNHYRVKPSSLEFVGRVVETGRDYGKNERDFLIKIKGADGRLPELGEIKFREILTDETL